jgi:hypothetical protein
MGRYLFYSMTFNAKFRVARCAAVPDACPEARVGQAIFFLFF